MGLSRDYTGIILELCMGYTIDDIGIVTLYRIFSGYIGVVYIEVL